MWHPQLKQLGVYLLEMIQRSKHKVESAYDEYKEFWKKGAETESDDNYSTCEVWQIFCQKLDELQTEDQLDAMVNWLQVRSAMGSS